ncbi:MAG: hypothetical protein ABIR71_06605 [Chthoniobacterales bacterium]
MKKLCLLAFAALLALPSLASAKKYDPRDLSLAWLVEAGNGGAFINWPVLASNFPQVPNGIPGTSGMLSTQSNQNWSTAPWMITQGGGTYPDGVVVATFKRAGQHHDRPYRRHSDHHRGRADHALRDQL